jgi:hypothetical protein
MNDSNGTTTFTTGKMTNSDIPYHKGESQEVAVNGSTGTELPKGLISESWKEASLKDVNEGKKRTKSSTGCSQLVSPSSIELELNYQLSYSDSPSPWAVAV